MFHFYINLAYYLPHIYLFFRIKDIFITKRYRLSYIIIYLLVALIYPVSERYDRSGNTIKEVLSACSDYLLPFYLYFFLGILLFDLFLLFNLFTRIVSDDTRRGFKFRLCTLSAIISSAIIIVAGGVINLNTIRVSEYKIEVPKRGSQTDHLKVAFVADFHINQEISPEFVDQFVRKINALQPDILLYGGDIIEGSRRNGTAGKTESMLRGVKTKYGSFGILGNHEGYGRRETGSFFRNSGITLLRDSIANIDSSFCLAGRLDQQVRRRKTVNELLAGNDIDLPVIMIDHRPTALQEASLSCVDVQFSGHTHNGQLFPLNLILHSMYELSWGYRKIRSAHFFVTSGLRLWGPPVKTAGKSEIMMVDIDFR